MDTRHTKVIGGTKGQGVWLLGTRDMQDDLGYYGTWGRGTILSTEYGYQTLGIKLGAMSFKLNNNKY